MAEVWCMGFTLAVRVRGIARRCIVWPYVARNALLPLVTIFYLQSAAIVWRQVGIKSVFSISDLRRLAQEAVGTIGPSLLICIILVRAVLIILINLVVDLLCSMLAAGSVQARLAHDVAPAITLSRGHGRLYHSRRLSRDGACSTVRLSARSAVDPRTRLCRPCPCPCPCHWHVSA